MAIRQEAVTRRIATARQEYVIPKWKDLTLTREEIREIQDHFAILDWTVIEWGDLRELVSVGPGCAVRCFDGRPGVEDPSIFVPGAAYGVGALSRIIDRRPGKHNDLLLEGCDIIMRAGCQPTFHGDDIHGPSGCGVVDLWLNERLPGLNEFPMSPEKALQLAEHDPQRLLYYTLTGGHQEGALAIILKRGATRIPDGGMFQITAWAGPLFGINPYDLAASAGDIINRLGGPRVAILYQ